MSKFSFYESKEAVAAIKRGHEAACQELDRRAASSIPESDPNHPMYQVAS